MSLSSGPNDSALCRLMAIAARAVRSTAGFGITALPPQGPVSLSLSKFRFLAAERLAIELGDILNRAARPGSANGLPGWADRRHDGDVAARGGRIRPGPARSVLGLNGRVGGDANWGLDRQVEGMLLCSDGSESLFPLTEQAVAFPVLSRSETVVLSFFLRSKTDADT
jgi:hypothetical protein